MKMTAIEIGQAGMELVQQFLASEGQNTHRDHFKPKSTDLIFDDNGQRVLVRTDSHNLSTDFLETRDSGFKHGRGWFNNQLSKPDKYPLYAHVNLKRNIVYLMKTVALKKYVADNKDRLRELRTKKPIDGETWGYSVALADLKSAGVIIAEWSKPAPEQERPSTLEGLFA